MPPSACRYSSMLMTTRSRRLTRSRLQRSAQRSNWPTGPTGHDEDDRGAPLAAQGEVALV